MISSPDFGQILLNDSGSGIKARLEGNRDKHTVDLILELPRVVLGDESTVGYFIPARRKRSDSDKKALREASTRWQEVLDAQGISEDEAVAGFKAQLSFSDGIVE